MPTTPAGTYLHHLTLDTGHARRSWRHEIAPDALAGSRQLLQRALDAGGAPGGSDAVPLPVPPLGRYSLTATGAGRCLVVTVHAADGGQLEPLATFGVATHSRCGASLWRRLRQGEPDTPTPPEPWCAARLQRGLMRDLAAAEWLGDLERCMAWAWLDLQAQRRAQSPAPDAST